MLNHSLRGRRHSSGAPKIDFVCLFVVESKMRAKMGLGLDDRPITAIGRH